LPFVGRQDDSYNLRTMNRKNATPKLEHPDPFKDEFHRLLGRLVHAQAMFDFNVGLQLNWMGPHCHEDVADLLNPVKTQLGTRLKKLKKLVLDVYEPAGEQAIAEFKAWFKKSDEARALRNDYVHGRWGVPGGYNFKPPGRIVDAEPLLAFVRLHWDTSPERPDDSIKMTLGEFAAQVTAVETLYAEYWRLTEKYLEYAKPSRSVISPG